MLFPCQRHACFHCCWYFSIVVDMAFPLKSEDYNIFLTSHLMLNCVNCNNTNLHWSAAIKWINHLLGQTQTNLLCSLEPRGRWDSSLDGKAVLNTLLFSSCYFWPNSALKKRFMAVTYTQSYSFVSIETLNPVRAHILVLHKPPPVLGNTHQHRAFFIWLDSYF